MRHTGRPLRRIRHNLVLLLFSSISSRCVGMLFSFRFVHYVVFSGERSLEPWVTIRQMSLSTLAVKSFLLCVFVVFYILCILADRF